MSVSLTPSANIGALRYLFLSWDIDVAIFHFLLIRYFLRLTIIKRFSNITKEEDFFVHALSAYPESNSSIKMEVGIEDCLHIEFEYNKSK
jgi:hypothetical protein